MASIQEEVTGQVWNLFLKFLGTGSEFVYQVAHEGNVLFKQGGNFGKELLLAMINKQKEKGEPTDVTARMLVREEKGESINSMAVAEEDAAELSKYFKDKEILFNVIENPNDDTKFFMYMSGDAQRVCDVVSLWQAEKGLVSELNPNLFLDNFAKEGVGTLSGLDRADLEVFRGYAKENNLVFTSTPTDKPDEYLIVYDPKDSDTVKKTMESVIWAFSGEEGARYREQMVVFLKNRQRINRSLLEAEKEFYIVNGKTPEKYACLTANDFTYYKNYKEVSSVSRSSDAFLDRALRVVDGMEQPVLLSRDEFELMNADGELDKKLVEKAVAEKAAQVPALDMLKEAQRKQNEKLELIQSKMALDDENTAGFWIYDDSIDFAGGGGYEETEDIDDQVKADVAAARSRASQYKFYEIDALDNRSLDYFIAEAEKHRKEPDAERESKEREV